MAAIFRRLSHPNLGIPGLTRLLGSMTPRRLTSQRCLRIFGLILNDPVVPIKIWIIFHLIILHVIHLRKSTGSGFLVRSEGGHPRFITLITPKLPARRPVPHAKDDEISGPSAKRSPCAVPSPPGASYSRPMSTQPRTRRRCMSCTNQRSLLTDWRRWRTS